MEDRGTPVTTQPAEQGSTILVIDDDPDSRTWARVWLQQAEYTVREATSAEEALAILASQPPDLILLDVMLPDMDGFELTRRLRQDPALSAIPIVLVTVLDDVDTKVRGLEAGAHDLLTKPPKQAELLARVRTLLHLKGKQEELLAEKNKTTLLYRISRELGAELDLDTLLCRILELTIEATGAARGSLILLDEEGRGLRHIYSRYGEFSTVTEVVRETVIREGLAGWVIREREAVIVPDTQLDPRWIPVEGSTNVSRSVLSVPLTHQERVVGVLTLVDEEEGGFSSSDLDLVESIASQSAVTLVKAQLFDEVEQERGRMKAFLIGTADAIVATDSKQRVALLNPSAELTFGVTYADVAGRPLEEALPNDKLVQAFRRAMEEEGPSPPTELTLPNGHTLFFTVSRVPAGPRGEGGWVAVMQDITHLKELDRMKNEFVSIVSHDLRTPLATIHGYAEVLQRMAEGEGKELAQQIRDSARRMADLVEELLDLGKIESGLETRREPCRLEELIAEAIKAAAFLARSRGVALEESIPTLSRPVLGNAIRLRQVLDNLLGNAIKYTPTGGLVTIGAWEKEGQVTVTVQDTGIGIPREALPRLFEKFYRVPRPDRAKTPGAGLGLAIVKAIVEQHGGQIWVESEPGQGSTFGFSLPLSPTEAAD